MLRHAEDIERIYALTAADIRKLRTADRISFHRSPDSSGIGASKERAVPRQGDNKLWEHDVPVHSTVKACYGSYKPVEGKELHEVAYCHHMIWYGNNIHEPWRTIAALLKTGDRLELVWTRDAGTNQYMEKSRLHGDRLQLVVHRGTGDKKKTLLFLIERQTCEDNTARMIRRGPYNTE